MYTRWAGEEFSPSSWYQCSSSASAEQLPWTLPTHQRTLPTPPWRVWRAVRRSQWSQRSPRRRVMGDAWDQYLHQKQFLIICHKTVIETHSGPVNPWHVRLACLNTSRTSVSGQLSRGRTRGDSSPRWGSAAASEHVAENNHITVEEEIHPPRSSSYCPTLWREWSEELRPRCCLASKEMEEDMMCRK